MNGLLAGEMTEADFTGRVNAMASQLRGERRVGEPRPPAKRPLGGSYS